MSKKFVKGFVEICALRAIWLTVVPLNPCWAIIFSNVHNLFAVGIC